MSVAAVIHRLGAVAELQWGLVTTAQAADMGVGRLQLSRLAQGGALERVGQGVYRLAGVPASPYEEIIATWLGIERVPDSLSSSVPPLVVAGAAAARLHGIGDLWLDRIDFIADTRRSIRRPDVRVRVRVLRPEEITIAEGLPVLTAARTLADLVESWTDLSLVADALRESLDRGILDQERLAEHLAPLAAANGLPAGDGAGFRDRLFEIAGAVLV